MFNTHGCLLTTKDYSILKTMLELASVRSDPIALLLRKKLSSAMIVFSGAIDPRAVTLNSRVVFRVNDGPSDTRVVVQGEDRSVAGMTIPISIPRGLGLLGLMEGQDLTIAMPGEFPDTIRVEKVAYQPEAAQRRKAEPSSKHLTPVELPQARRLADVVSLNARRVPAGH